MNIAARVRSVREAVFCERPDPRRRRVCPFTAAPQRRLRLRSKSPTTDGASAPEVAVAVGDIAGAGAGARGEADRGQRAGLLQRVRPVSHPGARRDRGQRRVGPGARARAGARRGWRRLRPDDARAVARELASPLLWPGAQLEAQAHRAGARHLPLRSVPAVHVLRRRVGLAGRAEICRRARARRG